MVKSAARSQLLELLEQIFSELRQNWQPLTAKYLQPTIIIFTILYVCSNTFEPLLMKVLCIKWL